MVEVVHDGDAHYRVVGVVVAFFSREGKTMVWTRIPVFFFGKGVEEDDGKRGEEAGWRRPARAHAKSVGRKP